jgi:glyoxylase-like metal-dependent hydrolase (beta-lactamase superfamily II)/poly(3-hydroxybutyrate) depolymerase
MKNRYWFTRLIVILAGILIAFTTHNCSNKQSNNTKKVSAEAALIAPLFEAGSFRDDKGNIMPYRFFKPAINEYEGLKYPLILYLHGEEEAGTDNETQLITTECATIWVEPDHLEKNPVYVLAPQIPAENDWTSDPAYSHTLELLNQFVESNPAIDTKRIYIVGFSRGATGVWNMILKNPKLFAAAMPISGNADKHLGDYEAWAGIKNMPIFVIHATDDQISPVSGSLNALAALRAAGNQYVSSSATACIWMAGSTPVPHDAWWTAFHKFEVVYNSLFESSLEKTNNGEFSPTIVYSKQDLGDGITSIWDYAQSTAFVIERSDKAIIVDATMGHGDIYQYIKDNVLVNKDIDIEIVLSHQHNDHIFGLTSFVGSPQVQCYYVHEEDKDPVIRTLGKDADKIKLVNDGDLIPLGGKNAEIVLVPGHSRGSIVMLYENYLFSGDAIGTGYVGVGVISIEEYVQHVQHLLDRMGNRKYVILGGHTGECRYPLNEEYVHNLHACSRGMADGSIASVPYWRNARYVATYGDASITHDLNNIKLIKGALFSLTISQGTLNPQFAAFTAYYAATVGENVNTIDIIPVARTKDYKGMTINGNKLASKDVYKANLVRGENRFSIVVTASDNTPRTYTLMISRGN